MICPYCDSRISVLPDDRVCPHCGGPLGSAGGRKLQFPEPPLGIYRDAAGYVEIGRDGVTFYRKHFFRAYKRTVPYSEIYAVAYKPGKRFDAGFLCVRPWQDRHLPMPTRTQEVVWDATAVYFKEPKNEQYHAVYMFLRLCADIANGGETESSLYGRYPGFYGYMELDAQTLTVYKDTRLMPATKRMIAYDEIAEVAFCEAKGSGRGGLSIRQRGDDKDIAQALRNAVTDDTSIEFTVSANDRMREIYARLAEYADENNRRWTQHSSKGM